MMESAFGIEHGEFSKGLPRAVASGGGGKYGELLRTKKQAGMDGAKHVGLRQFTIGNGRQAKDSVNHRLLRARVNARMKKEKRIA